MCAKCCAGSKGWAGAGGCAGAAGRCLPGWEWGVGKHRKQLSARAWWYFSPLMAGTQLITGIWRAHTSV